MLKPLQHPKSIESKLGPEIFSMRLLSLNLSDLQERQGKRQKISPAFSFGEELTQEACEYEKATAS
jgi:hypothetical protein